MACRGSRGGYGSPFLYCFCYLLKRCVGASNAKTKFGNGFRRSKTCGVRSLVKFRAKSGGGTRLGTGKVPRDLILDCSGSACWKLQMAKLTPEMDLGGQVRVGYEVWFGLSGSR
ncbi:hypothetical protein CDL15_Pgr009124 [Punica granatum]|uniref:Uncharacterized protein n=1 Tax=Punica granatum TaxID=22663 RepID=A0A218WN78_PUNGR|nr:hypothetical protein CDL15_Pgr009124 [Punica granatum]